MPHEKSHLDVTEIASPRQRRTPTPGARRRGLWNHLPAVVKIVLTVPMILALLGAEIEPRLAPQLDVILTAAGILGMWAWLSGAPSSIP